MQPRTLFSLFICVALLSTILPAARAQTNSSPAPDQPDWMSVDDWIDENFDTDVLNALGKLDADRLQTVITQLNAALHGTNLYQLGELRATAHEWLPILRKFDATEPYADWLETRLDYLEASEQIHQRMRLAFPHSGLLTPAPTLKIERQVWVSELKDRPVPRRAAGYLKELREIFISEHLPPELVWVAEVESNFNPRAKSPVGAAGLFQLMPDTARAEKLSLWPWDERYQATKNARAAARYLHTLHAHYHDWPLALAAYNCGGARVDKLLLRHHAKSFDAISRYLPSETQMYVPKIEATIFRREGKELTALKT